jgi:hypothetical protein
VLSQFLIRDPAANNENLIQISNLMYFCTPQIVLLTSPKLLSSTVTDHGEGFNDNICVGRAATGKKWKKILGRKHCHKIELFEGRTARILPLASVG